MLLILCVTMLLVPCVAMVTMYHLQIQLPVKYQSNMTKMEAINIQIRPTQGCIEFSEIEVSCSEHDLFIFDTRGQSVTYFELTVRQYYYLCMFTKRYSILLSTDLKYTNMLVLSISF